jgi:hypothetical protein
MTGKNWLVASCAAICGALCGSQTWAQTPKGLTVEVLSSRPELVSGGDAREDFERRRHAGVTVGGKDVSGVFKLDSKAPGSAVDGLKNGDNQLIAHAAR